MFKKKESKVKVEFTITLHSLKNVPKESVGNQFFIECKRGAKPKNHSTTQRVTFASGTSVAFEEKLKFLCTFFEDPKTKKLDQKDKKELSFAVKEEPKSDKKAVPFGKGSVNLTAFSDAGTIRHETVPIKPEKKISSSSSPTLMIKIEANWLKLDNKKIVKKTDVKEDTPKGGATEVKLGGEDYVLQTENDVTETNASRSDDEEEQEFPDEDNASRVSSSSDTKKTSTSNRNSLKHTDGEKKKNDDNDDDDGLLLLKERYETEIQDLIKDRDRLEKKVAKLSEKESNKSDSAAENAELEDLKTDNARLEKKVDRLTKELEEKKRELESDKKSRDVSTADKDQLKKVQDEKSKLEVKVAELQRQLDSETKSKLEIKQSLDRLKDDSKKKGRIDDESDTLRRQLEESKRTIEDTKKALDETKKSLKEAQDQITKQKEQIEKLEKQGKSTTSVVSGTSSSRSEDKKLSETVAQLQTQLEAERKEKAILVQSTEEQTIRIQELEKKQQKNKEKKKKYSRELEAIKSDKDITVADLNTKIASLEAEVNKKQEQIQTLAKSLESSGSSKSKDSKGSSPQVDILTRQLSDQKKEYADKLQASEKRIAELQAKLLQVDSKLSPSRDDKVSEDLRKELESLKKKFQEETKARENVEKELATLKKKQQMEDTSKRGNDDEEEQLKKKIASMRQEKEVEALKKKVASLQQEVEEKKLVESAIYAAEPEFDEEKHAPANVSVIVSSLVSWRSLEPPNEDLLSNIVGSVKKSFTRSAYDSEILAFWLSFTCSLYENLKNELPSSVKFDEHMVSQQFLHSAEDTESLEPIEKFFFELLLLAFDIYSVLLINIYSQLDHILLSPVLDSADPKADKKKQPNHDYTTILADIVKLLKKNYISERVQKQFLKQIFFFMDSQVFNTLVRRTDLYTASSGFQVKMAISQVENALGKVDKQLLSAAHQGLNHMREAANLLVMDKVIVGDEAAAADIFSHLNVAQIKHLVEKFKPDDLSPDPVPVSVAKSLELACAKHPEQTVQMDPMAIKRVDLLNGSLD